MIHDGDAVAELICLLHVMRGQQDGQALRVQAANVIPEEEARLRIEIIRRLIQEEHLRSMHQGAGDHQPLGHATGITIDFRSCVRPAQARPAVHRQRFSRMAVARHDRRHGR